MCPVPCSWARPAVGTGAGWLLPEGTGAGLFLPKGTGAGLFLPMSLACPKPRLHFSVPQSPLGGVSYLTGLL